MKKVIFILMVGSLFADEIDSSLKLAQEGKFEEAKTMIMPLAIQDNPEAQYWLSLFYSDPDALNQPLEGEKWLYKAAHNGNAMAQYRIGMNFSAGWLDSTIDSLVNAIYWFEKSGYNGNADAYANLGAMYDKENGNVLSEMEEAANYGNAMAQYNMGWIYARGLLTNEGLMQDIDIAKVWFEKSAALGFEDAKIILKKNFP